MRWEEVEMEGARGELANSEDEWAGRNRVLKLLVITSTRTIPSLHLDCQITKAI